MENGGTQLCQIRARNQNKNLIFGSYYTNVNYALVTVNRLFLFIFRVWSFDEKDGTSEILDLDRIKDAVTDSQRGDLTFVGGLAIPRISKIDGGGLVGALASLTPLLTVRELDITEPNDHLRLDVVQALPEIVSSI